MRNAISPIATPDFIIYSDLPKVHTFCHSTPFQSQESVLLSYYYYPLLCVQTRSGKIMRRILRKIAAGEEDSIGDVTTLADPSVRSPSVYSGEEMYVLLMSLLLFYRWWMH